MSDFKEQLKKYWDFFSHKSFDEGAIVDFFKDGSFAIGTTTYKNYYDCDCNQVDYLSGGDLRILANGVTIEVENDHILLSRNGIIKCLERNLIPYRAGDKVFTAASLVVLRNVNTKKYAFYKIANRISNKISVTQLDLELDENIVNVEASLDSSVFVVSFKGGMQRLYKYDVGKNHVYEVTPTAFTRVHVMECGCFIVNYDDCCKLHSPTGKLILSSNTSWGICDIGYDKVRFEGEVIIDVTSGRPLGEADAQISNMTRNGILHGRYFSKTVDGKRGFLCDSKLLPSICGSRFHDNLTVIYQQGTFYPTTFDVNDDIAGYQPNSYYYSRLRAMIPR